MFENFFITGEIPVNRLIGTYDFALIAVSYAIAALASYVALDMASQLGRENSPRLRTFWHVGGAVAMGAGIWAMHFTGMLAYRLDMEHSYHIGLTLLSLALPIAFSFAVLEIIKKQTLTGRQLLIAAPLLGLAIVFMHYIGMAAMDMRAALRYTPGWFAISVIIAITASAGALWLATIASRAKPGKAMSFKLLSAAVMGAAVCGMHYSGMHASVFLPFADCRLGPEFSAHNTVLAVGVTLVTLMILGIAIAALTLNQKVLEHLKGEVARRTQELQEANEQLTQAKETAEAASIAKGEFLANMSHEIRTPINAVVGIATLLRDRNVPPARFREYIDTLQLSAESLMGLINELLDISKIETNKIELEHVPFDLRELAEEVLALLSLRAQEKRVALRLNYHSPIARYIGDPLRVRQILVNLLSNGVKFTHQGSVELTIEDRALPGKQEVIISVADTGIGIAADKQNFIFEKFTQGDSSISRQYGGSGLGLAICKGLAEKMGGRIDLTSESGKGSKFIVHLPLVPGAANDALPRADLVVSNGAPVVMADKPTVLLVEDNPTNVLIASAYLSDMGYSYSVASNGKEAVEQHKETRFQLILMDVQMPVMDGYKAAHAIREYEAKAGLPQTPIIGVTAFVRVEDRQKCLAAGMNEYISKPFKPEELQRKIELLLNPPSGSPANDQAARKRA